MATGWHPTLDSFGARLLLLRHSLGLSQQEIAEKCGLDDGSWSNWERGASPRAMNTVVAKIVATIDVDRDWLMYGDELDTDDLVGARRSSDLLSRQNPCFMVSAA